MKSITKRPVCFIGILFLISGSLIDLMAQNPAAPKAPPVDDGSGGISWITILAVILGVGALGFLIWRRKNAESTGSADSKGKNLKRRSTDKDDHDFDAAIEIKWLEKVKSAIEPKRETKGGVKMSSGLQPAKAVNSPSAPDRPEIGSKQFQDRMRQIHYAQLPIHSFVNLTEARPFDPLPVSDDPSLLDAIEQAHEEFEDDESVRELAVRILAAFRSANSVEALSQIALYDLSVDVRSKAVAALTEFDHESVFEPILLACADPTREVRAVAARGLFRLSFDRAEAWKRLMVNDDKFRMAHAARAAIEAGIVQKSFERLIHDDMGIAYEAFSLAGLMVRSGETELMIEAIRNHKDERVRLALLHVLSVVKDDDTPNRLEKLLREESLPDEINSRIIAIVKGAKVVAA